MKKFILLFICIATLSSFSPVEDNKFNIVDKWTGEDKGDVGSLIFQSDGYAFIEFDGKEIGGKEFTYDNGSTGSLTYNINYDSEPITIDLIFSFITPKQEERKLLGILEVIDNNTINIALNFDGGPIRPTEFTEDNSMMFNRQE